METNCTISSCTVHKITMGYVYMGYWRYRLMAYDESLKEFDYFINIDCDSYLTKPWDFDPFQLNSFMTRISPDPIQQISKIINWTKGLKRRPMPFSVNHLRDEPTLTLSTPFLFSILTGSSIIGAYTDTFLVVGLISFDHPTFESLLGGYPLPTSIALMDKR